MRLTVHLQSKVADGLSAALQRSWPSWWTTVPVSSAVHPVANTLIDTRVCLSQIALSATVQDRDTCSM